MNKDLVTLTVDVREGPEGSLVDVDAELFKEIPNEIYVSKSIWNERNSITRSTQHKTQTIRFCCR